MKLAVGERNVATNLGIISGCVEEYYFSKARYLLRIEILAYPTCILHPR